MSSLSENMKNKRDVKRKHSLLIVDSDLGNIGLYKAMLSMEYDIDCVIALDKAVELCNQNMYDVIVVEGDFGTDNITSFFERLQGRQIICLVMSEPDNREQIIRCMCHGAYGYIPKPFTKEGMSGGIYNALKERRATVIMDSILILDDDLQNLNFMKSCLEDKYAVTIMNSTSIAASYIDKKRPDLIIADMRMPGLSDVDVKSRLQNVSEAEKIPVLFTAETLDPESLTICEGYNTAGFMVKPIDSEELKKNVERILLVEEYAENSNEV